MCALLVNLHQCGCGCFVQSFAYCGLLFLNMMFVPLKSERLACRRLLGTEVGEEAGKDFISSLGLWNFCRTVYSNTQILNESGKEDHGNIGI